jgi:exonuclease VII small subunit
MPDTKWASANARHDPQSFEAALAQWKQSSDQLKRAELRLHESKRSWPEHRSVVKPLESEVTRLRSQTEAARKTVNGAIAARSAAMGAYRAKLHAGQEQDSQSPTHMRER